MTSIELCTKINAYLLDNNCQAIDFIFSTYVIDSDKEVISRVINKFIEDSLSCKLTELLLEDDAFLAKILHICQDATKMSYLCSVVQDATKALEESKKSLLYTSDTTALADARYDPAQTKCLNQNTLFVAVATFGTIIVICIFAYIFCVTFFAEHIKADNVRFVDQTLGNFNAILQTVIVYLFNMGTSQLGTKFGIQQTSKPASQENIQPILAAGSQDVHSTK